MYTNYISTPSGQRYHTLQMHHLAAAQSVDLGCSTTKCFLDCVIYYNIGHVRSLPRTK